MSSKKKEKYRNRFEESIAKQLESLKCPFVYEELKLSYTKPATMHSYLTDFYLIGDGIVLETKGRFTLEDRKKHLYIRQCNPFIDIRFVFQNAYNKIRKGSRTTYADWCDKNCFEWAHKEVPKEWLI